jgi:hypothetical protein
MFGAFVSRIKRKSLIIFLFSYVILFLYSLICHYMYETWSWHAYSYALGFLWKNRCDRSARSQPLRTDRQSNHVSLDSYRTNRPPCYGRGCGVRLVVDSTLPVGGSVWSWWETTFLLRRLRPGEAGEGIHSFEGPLAGSTSFTAGAAPYSETQEGTIHLLGL